MAERVDVVAVDVRDGTGAAHLQVAVDQHHADRIARLQRTVERHLAGAQADGAAAGRHESLAAEGAAEQLAHLRSEAGHDERRRDRTKERAELTAGESRDGIHAVQFCIARPIGKGPIPVEPPRSAAVRFSSRQRQIDAGSSNPAAAPRRMIVESVISAIGVMPAIGSLENAPSAYETAPMSRPSM